MMAVWKKTVLVIVIGLSWSVLTDALSCVPCSQVLCLKPECCPGGLVKDVCQCCDVCAKVLGEECGGPFDINGKCDVGLSCIKPSTPDPFNAVGKCGCSPFICALFCKYGFVKNRYGCNTCSCNPPPVDCGSPYTCKCAYGVEYYFDENGCQKCRCNPAPESICNLPQVVGPCEAAIPRWWFNCKIGVCEKFTYGGCKGNANNFEKKEDCEKACPEKKVDLCKLPKVVGPCKAAFPRWWFNYASGACEHFIYGGCNGNANNFATKEDCEKACPKKQCDPPKCDLFCPLGFRLGPDGCPVCKCKECPTPEVNCLVSPCSVAPKVCAGHPQARCVDNYCGGCNALWFIGNRQVKCVCKPRKCSVFCPLGYETGPDGCPTCKCRCCPPPNPPCFVAPCTFQKCPRYPKATCIADFCNDRCGVSRWFVGKNEVKCECPLLKCRPCDFGYVIDSQGCQTCQCKLGACLEDKPPKGQVCTQVITKFCTEDCKCCEHRNGCNPKPSLYTKDPSKCP